MPTVDRFKFLTRGKFMTNVCDRWAFRKVDNLQSAWFNGAGYESWESEDSAPPMRRAVHAPVLSRPLRPIPFVAVDPTAEKKAALTCTLPLLRARITDVWGTWNGIVPRDAEAIRRVATMMRFFGGLGGLLHSPDWEPHTPAPLSDGVFASACVRRKNNGAARARPPRHAVPVPL